MKVGVVGASGYVGGETLRLLVNHPKVEITSYIKTACRRVSPQSSTKFEGFSDLTFSELDYDKLTDKCVFTQCHMELPQKL